MVVSMAVFPDSRATFFRRGVMALLAGGFLTCAVFAADSNNLSSSATLPNSEESVRASLQVQEQLRITQLTMERNRLEAQIQSESNAAAFAQRLEAMEKGIASQHAQDIANLQRSESRTMLLMAALFGGVALLVLIAVGYLQTMAMNRMAMASRLSPSRSLAAGVETEFVPALPAQAAGQSPAVAQSNARLLDIIDRLEHRIRQFDESNRPLHAAHEHGATNGTAHGHSAPPALKAGESAAFGPEEKVMLLMAKAQTLVKMDQSEEALAVLDEALAIDPDNTDALVKKGAALDRLQRVDEAISCFDRAIAKDPSAAMAYLLKGALYNRLERFNESLACYEQALKIKEAANGAGSGSTRGGSA
jgi:tetratricopeptide (TPR) repeat protein